MSDKKKKVFPPKMVRRKKHQEQFEPLMVPESTKPQEQMMDPLQLEYEFKKELSEPSSDITDSLQLEHQIEETPGVPVSGIEEFLQYKHQFNEKPDVSSPGVANPLPLENQFKEETEVPPLGVATSNENQIKSTSIDNNIIIITTDCAVQPQQQLAVASYPQWEAATMTPNNIAGTLITGVQNVSQAHFQNYIAPIVPSFFISNLVDLNTIQPMDQQSQEQQSQEQQSNLNTTANERKRMESTTPRRPVILKSDRDPAKEPPKEKQEKEKQPTIILKTREQSTPKEERPQSPKTLKTPTDEGPQPCKIAQNENKEKKHSESKICPPLKQMTEPVKLLDENLELNNAALEFLHDSSTNYLVVGIIGTQSVGKSMILNLISQNTHTPNLCTQILHSHELSEGAYEMNDTANIDNHMEALDIARSPEKAVKNDNFKFKMQDLHQIERGVHCTRGIDMYVTNDRVILLDCQALCSPSLIEESKANPITAKSANMVTVDSLQIASYLMAICHVLIAVQDWFTDYNFIRYIQAAEMLKPSLSASNTMANQEGSESTGGGECHPHLLLLHNRCQLEDFTPEAVKYMQELYRNAFQKSNLQLNSGMYMYSDTNKNGLNVDNVCKGYSVDNCGTPINLFLLPEIYEDFDNREIYRGHPPFEQLAKRLRWMILGVNRHQITNVANLSERGWFHYCTKAWETIRKCTFFMEYERFLP